MYQFARTILWLMTLLCMTSRHADASSDCPSSACSCTVQLIDCRYKVGQGGEPLTSVPQFRPSQIRYRELSLKDNNIKQISDEAFSGLMIDKLDLTSNPLVTISPTAFQNIVNLVELRLTLDAKALFPSQALSTLQQLRVLEVYDYGYSSLPPGNVFQGLTQLNKLILKNGQLAELKSEALQDQRDNLSLIDISENQFSAVPTEALRSLNNLTQLLMDKNQIRKLGSESFEGLRLVELRMSYYSSLMIDNDAFRPLRSTLNILQMSSCQLNNENVQPIRFLYNLTHLDLFTNLVTNIDGLFSSLSKLRHINLAYNSISSLTSTTLEGLSELNILHLSRNPLQLVDSRAFNHLTALQQLFLDDVVQGLQALDDTSLKAQRNTLEVLSLDRSTLRNEQWSIVSHLFNLKLLRISNCSLGNIPDYNFRYLNHLATLAINNNNIDHINAYSLYGLHESLEWLELIGNKLSSMDPCSLNTVDSKPIQLYLQSNPLKCDCRLFWLYDWLVINNNKSLAWTCADGRRVSDLSAEDFRDCGNNASYSCPDWASLFTTAAPPTIQISVSNKSSAWIEVGWTMEGLQEVVVGFRLTHKVNNQITNSTSIDGNVRSHTVNHLLPNTWYAFCIYLDNSPYNVSNCVDVQTLEAPINTSAEEESLSILWFRLIVGGAAAAAVLFLLLLLCCCCVLRRRSRRRRHSEVSLRYLKNPVMVPDAPQIGESSKRFLKPRPPSQISEAPSRAKSIADQLNTLSDDERYRLVNLLTHSGGSLASIPYTYIPTAGGYPYESRFQTMPSELRVGMQHNYSLERRRAPLESHRHVYEEIDDEFYDEISMDDAI